MPSPFPGIDPYLEGSLWASVHTQLAVEIARQLTPTLVPRYIPLTEKRFVVVMPEAVPQVTVEIRDTANRRLVTAIEVLSPTNKLGDGRREYLEKRQRLLLSSAHLIEIDLLREGERVPMRKPLPPAPYFVLLSRAGRRPTTEVWPIRLSEPLPTIPVPLLEGDPDVPLDLQLALTSVYDAFGYSAVLDYKRPPETPLTPDDAAWAAEILRNHV